jgi:hypothetical protein
MASAARDLIIQRLSLVRSLCESEEQRLLEQVHGEEERAHQSILTQRAHWVDAVQKLDTLRTNMVDMITHLDDLQLIVSQERGRAREVGQDPPGCEELENVCGRNGDWQGALGTGMGADAFSPDFEAPPIEAHLCTSSAKNPAKSALPQAPTTDI